MPRKQPPASKPQAAPTQAHSSRDAEAANNRPHATTHHKPRRIDIHYWVTTAIALLAIFVEWVKGCAHPPHR